MIFFHYPFHCYEFSLQTLPTGSTLTNNLHTITRILRSGSTTIWEEKCQKEAIKLYSLILAALPLDERDA